jgi:osmoprotectant transport system ATP-binding protein
MVTPIITFTNVSKRYGDTVVLSEIELEIPNGQTTVIVGQSGSGKTTLLRMVNGLIKPDSGRLEVFGDLVPEENIENFRRKIGYAVQGAGLFPHVSVKENIVLIARLVGWSSQDLDERFEMLMRQMELPLDLSDRIPNELSGGQQQRVGLCRALMLKPKLLLLDEPFSAVDPLTRLELYEVVEKLISNEAVSIVMVSHDLGEAKRLGDRMVVLQNGIILQNDLISNVIGNPATPYVERLVQSAT